MLSVSSALCPSCLPEPEQNFLFHHRKHNPDCVGLGSNAKSGLVRVGKRGAAYWLVWDRQHKWTAIVGKVMKGLVAMGTGVCGLVVVAKVTEGRVDLPRARDQPVKSRRTNWMESKPTSRWGSARLL